RQAVDETARPPGAQFVVRIERREERKVGGLGRLRLTGDVVPLEVVDLDVPALRAAWWNLLHAQDPWDRTAQLREGTVLELFVVAFAEDVALGTIGIDDAGLGGPADER